MLIYLPCGQHGEKVGVDDYLVAGHSVDNLLSLASSELRTPANADGRGDFDPNDMSQADALVEIGRQGELFHDGVGTGYVTFVVGDHHETWSLSSKRFRTWLRRAYYERTGRAVASEAIKAACGLLEGLATYDGVELSVSNRIGRAGDSVVYDLADASWHSVEIGPGQWSITPKSGIRFRRYAHHAPQVEPRPKGDIRCVLHYLNVRPEDRLLLLVWLVAAFIPDIPHPIPDFHGEKGAGKSVGQRVLRRLIDPSHAESLSFPRDVAELVQQLSHHYAPIYDNVDDIPAWLSDVLCRAVTGEGFTKRELYTDDDDVIYAYRRVVLLNGINVVPRRADLLDRSILVHLVRINPATRRDEKSLWADFERDRPSILGGIFDTLAEALRLLPEIRLERLPRMADFTRYGAAIALALGYSVEEFLGAYEANLGMQTAEAVAGNLVGAAILALMEDREEWVGRPTDLLQVLEDVGAERKLFKRTSTGKVDAKGWPGAAHILTRRINEVRSNLRDLGLEVIDRHGDRRLITIRRVKPSSETGVGSVGSVGDSTAPDATNATDATFRTRQEAVEPDERTSLERETVYL